MSKVLRMAAAAAATAWIAAAALVAPATQAASGFGVSPIRLDLSGQRPRAHFTVSNPGDATVVIQARQFTWTQRDGRDHYEETKDFVLNPVVFTIAPGRKQVVRLSLRAAPDGTRERGYRVVFTEVPRPGQDGGKPSGPIRMKVIKQMNLPVYVAPLSGEPEAKGSIVASREGDLIRVRLRNEGTGHWRLSELSIAAGDDPAQELSMPQIVAVLPESERVIDLAAPAGARIGELRVRGSVYGEPFGASVPLDSRRR